MLGPKLALQMSLFLPPIQAVWPGPQEGGHQVQEGEAAPSRRSHLVQRGESG